MKLFKWIFVLSVVGVVGSLFSPRALAVVDVSSSELQASASIFIPNADSFGALKGYSGFKFDGKSAVEGGELARYRALLLADPWLDSELPELQLLVYSYADQDSARATFDSLSEQSGFQNGRKTLLESDTHSLYYQSNFGGSGVDVFGTVDAEYYSLHLVEWNGNLIFQTSIYRTDGVGSETNLKTYANAITYIDDVHTILEDSLDNAKLALGLLFPPTQSLWSSQSEKSSLNLSNSYSIPSHGTIHLDVYVSDPSAAVGTILDSSGINTPSEGDLYLYINSSGKLFAGLYAPSFDADCEQEIGWYRLESDTSLYPYEWNAIDLHYGVGGFSLALDGVTEASCSVSQPRSTNDLYLGDFPGDSIAESMIGAVNEVTMSPSLTETGLVWDAVLTDHLFIDLPDTDQDLPIFQYLKEKGIFTGSDGVLSPDETLNRAQMVKVLLKTFKRSPDAGILAPFWDVPADAWYRKYIAKAYSVGMITGHEDGTFLPAHQINRAEFFTMLYRINGSKKMEYNGEYSDVSEDDWFAVGAAYAVSKGLVRNTLFEPTQTLTRREAAHFLYSILNP